MKAVFLIMVSFCPLFTSFSQGIDIMDKGRIKQNKIKSQTLYEYDYVKGKPEKKGTKSRIVNFDQQGNKIEETNYRFNGSLLSIVSFKYDETGNKTEYAKYSGDDKELKYKQTLKFDSKGNKLMESGFNGLQNFKTSYSYSPEGKLIEVNYFIEQSLDEKRTYKYSGNTAELTVLDGAGNVRFTQKNTYTSSGKILEESKLENNVLTRKVTYTYDANDNLISETKYMRGKLAGKITHVYDNFGRLSEVYQEGETGNKYMTNKYTYNQKGWVIEELSRSEPDKDFSKNIYTYDENGICKTIDSYYAAYKQQVLSVFTYENF
jgi:YD repeat-containing protein